MMDEKAPYEDLKDEHLKLQSGASQSSLEMRDKVSKDLNTIHVEGSMSNIIKRRHASLNQSPSAASRTHYLNRSDL